MLWRATVLLLMLLGMHSCCFAVRVMLASSNGLGNTLLFKSFYAIPIESHHWNFNEWQDLQTNTLLLYISLCDCFELNFLVEWSMIDGRQTDRQTDRQTGWFSCHPFLVECVMGRLNFRMNLAFLPISPNVPAHTSSRLFTLLSVAWSWSFYL